MSRGKRREIKSMRHRKQKQS